IDIISLLNTSKPGAAIITAPNATAEDVANIGPIEPLAPMLNVCILDDRNLWNKKADKRIATIKAM
ncbi:hypothetical protein, partial [Escherichia coli]|uniref:hypothetical protein n=1 Tax=Escherichia coli TaxID=562 RepID=UPI0019000849